jgi:hypothetical protein
MKIIGFRFFEAVYKQFESRVENEMNRKVKIEIVLFFLDVNF